MIAVAWIVIALAAPLLAPHDPLAQDLPRLAAPGPGHWFGTDQLGRDILSRVMYGARLSIPLTLLLVALSVLIGGLLEPAPDISVNGLMRRSCGSPTSSSPSPP
ncbi:hypothetical protein ACFQX6_05005 [Streptosporangium lutulentum]